jgi:RNA polymerase sigma-70 factor (ECF subfamily)
MVVILSDLQEFSYKEIAEILDCPVGTVMSRLFRGRRLLQRELAGYAVERGIPVGSELDAGELPASLDEYRKRRARTE